MYDFNLLACISNKYKYCIALNGEILLFLCYVEKYRSRIVESKFGG